MTDVACEPTSRERQDDEIEARMTEVWQSYEAGNSPKSIAAELGLKLNTVYRDIRNMCIVKGVGPITRRAMRRRAKAR